MSSPEQVILVNVLAGFLWAGFNLSNFNLLLELSPSGERAQAVALYQMIVFAAAVAGPLLGGYLIDAIGYRFVFGFSSVGRLAGIVLFIWLYK